MCRIAPTADRIRLIGPNDVLQIRMRSLLERHIVPVVSFSPTHECVNPGERIKKGMQISGLREINALAMEKRV